MAGKRRILVVDDQATVRTIVKKTLEAAGYTVDTADNGLLALQAIDKDPPALVITDIMMPELDGLELVEGLRHRSETHALPIIFMTASDDPQHFARSLNIKAKQFMSKPFSREELLKRVQMIIGAP